ncbi:hypothetical protein C8J57DRAFT_1243912 [Mycena rebaudengoi]|nr:hypothetical protein C8J57DRAFT_1243912 [Mycena rebaudengoi]
MCAGCRELSDDAGVREKSWPEVLLPHGGCGPVQCGIDGFSRCPNGWVPGMSWDQQYIGGPPKQAQTSLVEVGGIIGSMGDSEMVLGTRFIVVIKKNALGAIWMTAAAEEMMAHHTHNAITEFSGTRVRRLDVLVPLNKKKDHPHGWIGLGRGWGRHEETMENSGRGWAGRLQWGGDRGEMMEVG